MIETYPLPTTKARPPEGSFCPLCDPDFLDSYDVVTKDDLSEQMLAHRADVMSKDRKRKMLRAVAVGRDWYVEMRWGKTCAVHRGSPLYFIVHEPVTILVYPEDPWEG